MLISSEILSLGLNETKSLASLLFALGDCKTGLVWAKQVNSLSFFNTNVSQSLNFPILFNSSADTKVIEKIKILKINIIILLIMDLDLDIFFELH